MNFKLTSNGQIPKHVENFINTLPKEQKFSNVYEITVENKEGHIIDTKYGVNIMTTRGFQREAACNGSPGYIIIGKGTGTATIDDTLMFEDIPNIRSINESHYGCEGSNAGASGLTNTYDPVSNCMIGRRLTGSFTMDYETVNDTVLEADNLPHITEFAEFELDWYNSGDDRPYDPEHYANSNIMHTHCLIYDANHQPSYFDKIRGTKVTVRIYRANKVSCALLDSLWNQGIYMFISPAYMVKDPSNGGSNYLPWKMLGALGSVICGRNRTEDDFPLYAINNGRIAWGDISDFNNLFRWYNWGYGHQQDSYGKVVINQGGNNAANVAVTPSGYRNNITFPEFIQTDTEYVKAGIIFLHYNRGDQVDGYWGYRHNQTGQKATANQFFAFEKINLNEPEEMTLDWAYTDDFLHPQFRNIFGLTHYFPGMQQMSKQQIPCNDFHLVSVKKYNYLTDDWEDVQFTDDPTYDFRNPERAAWGHMFLSGFKNGGTFDVYLNINNQVAIEGFNEIATYEIYMTDTYWDYTSFVKLEDNHVVPTALQHKKYIIKYPSSSPWNSNDGMAKTGIHPQRAVNNHAIVLSDNIRKIDTPKVPMVNYSWRSFKKVYASDEGWAFCNGILIYLESDDGTGHPYRYNINVPNNGDQVPDWAIIKYTPNRIIVFDGRNQIKPSDVTNPRFVVYYIDPSNPDIDPNTTAIPYYDGDIAFGTTGITNSYLGDWCFCLCDPGNNKLYFNRFGTLLMVDLDETTHNIENLTDASLPNPVHISTGMPCGRWNVIFGTKYFISHYHDNTDPEQWVFEVYDLENREVYKSFTINKTYNSSMRMDGMFGYKEMIYFQCVFDGTYHVFTYNYETEELVDHETWCWNYLYLCSDNNGTYTLRSWNHKMNMMAYNDDAFVVNCVSPASGDRTNLGARSIVITSDELDRPYFFDANAATGAYETGEHRDHNRANSYITGSHHGMPCIKKFNNGKDFMVLIDGNVGFNLSTGDQNWADQNAASYVFNFGYIKNKQLHTPEQLYSNYAAPMWKLPNIVAGCGGAYLYNNPGYLSYFKYQFGSGITYFAETCFYKNKVLVFTTFDQPLLVPLDTFLHYKITGTTNTIQAHNHPRKFNQHTHGAIVDMIENL